jgi:hypothetical protein
MDRRVKPGDDSVAGQRWRQIRQSQDSFCVARIGKAGDDSL